jgi:hypothetical protein
MQHADAPCNRHADGATTNRDAVRDAGSNADRHRTADRDSHCHTVRDTGGHRNSYRYCRADSHSNRGAHGHGDPTADRCRDDRTHAAGR